MNAFVCKLIESVVQYKEERSLGIYGRKNFWKEKRNLEIGVQELVRRTSKAQNRVIQIGPKTFKNRNDKVGQLLIDFYDKHEGHGDIQKELNKHFVAGAMENLQEREKRKKNLKN